MKYLQKRTKKILLITFFALQTMFVQAQGDTTYTGNIIVTTQATVDALRDTLAGKTRINGNLTIGYTSGSSQSDITDLTPLSNIVHITGDLTIRRNGQLVNLNALTHLQTIGGYFRVESNAKLTDLGDFPSLRSIGTNDSYGYFNRLTSIVVRDNPSLSDCRVLTKFLSGGTYAVSGEIYISENTDGCSSKGDIKAEYIGDITVRTQAEGNDLRTGLLAGKTRIDGDLTIGYTSGSSQSDITSLTFLRNIEYITGNLVIQQNGSLVNLSGIRLRTVGGDCRVLRNPVLSTLTFGDDLYYALQTIGGDFHVLQNSDLSTLGDFSFLYSIGGYFHVSNNDRLTTLGDFLTLDSIGVYFHVSSNDQLTTLGEFPALETIGVYFHVSSNDQLTTLGKFPALETIGEYFYVDSNDTLTTLGNFPALTSIGVGRVSVPSERQTTDNVSIVVENNLKLSDCYYVLTDFLPGEDHAVSGGIYINNNATDGGCNSQNGIINSIYRGDITVTTQAEVDSLRTTLAGKTRINGNLTIGYVSGSSQSDITDLSPLRNIVRITGHLRIDRNGQLVNLNGLNNLQSIGSYFGVYRNGRLTILGDFPTLQSIGLYFNANSNDQLITLGNFSALQTIGAAFLVWNNSNLTTLGNFSVLDSIGSYFRVNDNDQLTTLGDFSALQIIKEYFGVYNNDTLTTLGNFPALTSIGIDNNIRVPSLNNGFTNNVSILVENNPNLSDCYVLTDFLPDGAHAVGGDIYIEGNASVSVCNSKNDLINTIYRGDYIGGLELTIRGVVVDVQEQVDALRTTLLGKTIIDGNLIIGDFESQGVTDLTPLSNIAHITGNLNIRENSQLVNLTGLNNLRSIGGNFLVYNNDILTLGNFLDLQSIGGSFNVNTNDRLASLGSFPTLTSIGIGRSTVPSISNYQYYTNNVSIVVEENPNLVLCSWLENFLPDGNHAVTGDIYIQDNATGCNSTEEINNPVLVAKNRIFAHTDSTTTSFNISANVRWKLVISDDATWITSLSSRSNTHSSRITGENEATITLIHTRAPNETQRSTTLMLTAIDENGEELMNPATRTINFTQLKVYEGDITLCSQEKVDEFISNTAAIFGNLTIGCYTYDADSRIEITDLSPLRNITDITGNLIIQQNGQLVNLTALNNLQTIGGDFQVRSNGELTTLGNFPDLQTIGGDFQVRSNGELTTLGNFPDLQTIGGYFEVSNNDTLTILGDFPTLTSIGIQRNRFLTINGYEIFANPSILIDSNPKLSDCYVLTEFLPGGAHAVSGDIFISNNAGVCTNQSALSNTIYRGDITVTTQAAVDALRTTLAGKTRINGNVTIGSSSDITDLTPLGSIVRITGNLIIRQNLQLDNLNGLNNLQTIGGYFSVFSNDKLTNLGDFPVLQTIGGYFLVFSNGKLTDLGDFPVLQSIGENFSVTNNDTLTSLGNFPALTSIGVGSVYRTSERQTIDNVSIVVESNSSLSDCYTLTDFLPGGTHAVSGEIYINNNAGVCTDQSALSNTIYRGDITVRTQAEVFDLGVALGANTIFAGNLTIGSSIDITVLTFLDNIVHITGNLRIIQNGRLANLNGLHGLQTIGGYFQVFSNGALTDLGDFPVLQSIGGGFIIWLNQRLTGLGDFPALQTIGESGLSVTVNNILTSFGNFPALQTIGSLSVNSNAELTDLGDFPALQTIGGIFYVFSNDELTDLGNFPVLQTIGGYFRVWRNDKLTTLRNFTTLTSIGSTNVGSNVSIQVEDNSSLSDCYTLTDFLPGGSHAVSGEIYINNNAVGCNNGDEIMASAPHTIILTSHTDGESIAIAYDEVVAQTIIFSIGGGATGWTSEITGDDFITLDPAMNVADTGVAITVRATPPENTGVARSATIKIITMGGTGAAATFTVTITQAAAPPMLTLSSSSTVTLAHDVVAAQTITFTVGGSATGWASSMSGENFITLLDDGNETGDVVVTATPSANTGVERGATITFTTSGGVGDAATAMVTIRQEAAPPTLVLSSGATVTLGYDATIAEDIRLTLGGGATGWTSSIEYTPDVNSGGEEFITLNPSMGGATGNVGVSVELTENIGAERTAIITITTTGRGTPVSQTVTIMQAQSNTHTGNITVRTQAEVDSLRDTLAGKTIIDGNVTIGEIGGSSDITDLTPLNNLQTIEGYFLVFDNDSLATLGDFPVLQTIGGAFGASRNNTLTTFGDFPALQSIGGEFGAINNDRITTLGDFPALQSIGGRFVMVGNTKLTTLGNFPALTSIGETNGESISVEGSPNLVGCFILTEFLPGGTHAVSGGITIYNNASCNDYAIMNKIYYVNTQLEVDFLGATLANVDTIDGNLIIGSTESSYGDIPSDITDLTPLSNIVRVTGDLFIQENGILVNLNGLNNLQSIGGSFHVISNDKLTTLGNFTALQSIGEHFYVYNNDKLLSLGDFPNLTSVGIGRDRFGKYVIPFNRLYARDSVSIVVEENPNLVLCSWLENFLPDGNHAVTGDIYIQDNATGCNSTEEINNPVLLANNRIFVHKDSTTTSFNIYANVRWRLAISDDATWITSLSSGSSTHSSRIIGENEATITLIHTRAPDETPRSTTLTLTAIDEEGNELVNPATITINLDQLILYEGNITLSSQEEVDEFVSNTTVIDGNLTIGYTDFSSSRSDITDLMPLSNITDITGNLIIRQNGQLVNLNGLNNLQTIGGFFNVNRNDSLTTLSNFPVLQTIGGSFIAQSNDSLTTLGDFPVLRSIGGYFNVNNNDVLTTLGDFPVLRSIGGYFNVNNNDVLTTLGDFPDLQTIGEYFNVNNDVLTTLGDFPDLQTIGEYFLCK